MNRWLNHILAAALCAALLLSCSSDDSVDTVTYLPVKLVDSDGWTLINADGDTLPDCHFSSAPSPVINGYFSVTDFDGHLALYHFNEPSKPLPFLSNLLDAGYVDSRSATVAIVRDNSRISLVSVDDGSGHELSPVDGKEITHCARFFSCDRMVIMTADSLFGAVNPRGDMAIEPRYLSLNPFCHDKAIARDSRSYLVIDTDGRELCRLKPTMQPLSSILNDDIISVDYDGRIGFVNLDGTFRAAPANVVDIQDFNRKFFVYRLDDDRYGVMDYNMHSILPPDYTAIRCIYRDNWFVAQDTDGRWAVIDTKGRPILTFDDAVDLWAPSTMGLFGCDFKFIARLDDDTYYIYGENGEPLGPAIEHIDLSMPHIYFLPLAPDNMMASDWLDTSSIVTDLLSRLTTDGYGEAHLHNVIGQLATSEPEDYVDSYAIEFYDSSSDLYSISATARSLQPVASVQTIYEEHTYYFIPIKVPVGAELAFDHDALISSIAVSLDTRSRSWTALRGKLIDALPSHGYTVTDHTDAYIVASSDRATLLIGASRGCRGLEIHIYPPSSYQSYASTLKRNAEINYAQGS